MIPRITDIDGALADWPATLAALADFSPRGEAPWPEAQANAALPLKDLEILPPVVPRQVFQSGANYRTHVIDLMVARQGEQARERAAAMMDDRARNDQPYVFVGLPSALCGPEDDAARTRPRSCRPARGSSPPPSPAIR